MWISSFGRRGAVALLILALVPAAGAQPPAAGKGKAAADAPIPDVPTLMAEVRAHQKQVEAIQENYTFREDDVTEILNKNGSVKKTESQTYHDFFVNSHEIQRLIAKNGKPLDAGQQRREQDRVMKAVERAQKTPPGQAQPGQVVISVSQILAVVSVTAPRRVMLDGRPTITFSFTGNPHAKAHGMAEKAARKLTGTVWIDEKDREVRKMTATLDGNFHVGFGMFSLGKGSNMIFNQKLVNNELWLPTSAEIYISAHAFGVFGAHARIRVTDSEYRKFHAEAVQQPGAAVVQPATR